MKVYLTRHGETDWNKQKIIQGITDNPLNQIGINQANQIKQFFDDKSLDLVISSSLQRAITTANIATNQEPDLIDDNFIERNFGYFDGKDVDYFYSYENLEHITDYEQDQTITNRVISGLNSYVDQELEEIAIFAHSHVLKAALSAIEPEQFNFSSKIKNCAIIELEYTNNNWKLIDIH